MIAGIPHNRMTGMAFSLCSLFLLDPVVRADTRLTRGEG
jgi:hypothetical protein